MPKVTVLNRRQLDFCNNFLEGMTASEAYAAAGYETGKMTPAVLKAASSRLLANKAVQEYMVVRQRELEAVTKITREKSALDTVEMMNECAQKFKETGNPAMANAWYRGADILNRVMGHYAPEKKEISGAITVNFSVPEPEPIEVSGEIIDIIEEDQL